MKNRINAEKSSRADWARRIRERSGLSRRAFGEKYGINPKTIEAWEYGYGNPQEYVLELLEKAEALEQVQCYAYFFQEYRADWGQGFWENVQGRRRCSGVLLEDMGGHERRRPGNLH